MTDLENNLDVTKADDNMLSENVKAESVSVKNDVVEEAVVEEVKLVKETVEVKPVVEAEEAKPENVIGSGSTSPKPTEKAAIAPVANGVIGSGKSKVEKKADAKPKAASAEKVEKVALFANRNIVWQGVGKIVKGYNLVDESTVSKWLTLEGVRKVTPQEVKTVLG